MDNLFRTLKNFAASCGGTKYVAPDGNSYGTGLPGTCANSSSLQNILQITFGIVAAVAVIIIMIGGIQFLTSQGNPENTNKARNTIVYAAIGLVIALSAEALVTFVLGSLLRG